MSKLSSEMTKFENIIGYTIKNTAIAIKNNKPILTSFVFNTAKCFNFSKQTDTNKITTNGSIYML